MVVAIYRYPDPSEGSVLPYVMTCPPPDCKLAFKDKMFIAANPKALAEYLPVLSERLLEEPDGSMALAECLSEEINPDGEDKKSSLGTLERASTQTDQGASSPESPASKRSQSISTPVSLTRTGQRHSPLKNAGENDTSPVRAAVSRLYFAGEENQEL